MTSANSISATALIRDLFPGLAEADLLAMQDVAQERHYPAGTVLCQQGKAEHTFYIIATGNAVVFQSLPGDAERMIGNLGPGQFFGERALIDKQPRTVSVRAIEPIGVLEITEEAFDAVLSRSPAVAMVVLRQVANSADDNDRRTIEELQAKHAELQAKNVELARAHEGIKEAQAQLVKREMLDRDLDLAVAVQRGLLPSEVPPFEGFRFAGRIMPMRHVGGDLYDVYWLDQDHVGLLLADVSGKSVQAALFMAVTKTLFQQASKSSLSPAEVAGQVHEGLLDVSESYKIHVTAFYGVLNCRTGLLRYVRAGHERTVLLTADRPAKLLSRGVPPFLGDPLEGPLEEQTLTLKPGDMLAMYSDGLQEAPNPSGTILGEEALMALIDRQRGKRPDQAVMDIFDEVLEYCDGTLPDDDMSLLVVSAWEE